MSYASQPDNHCLQIWTVYEKPKDYPAQYVARLFISDKPTDKAVFSTTLEGVRAQLPPGLYRLPRQPGDVPNIVETWF